MAATKARVAASSGEVDEDGVRLPAGEVHAWEPGINSTACGLALSRSRLLRFQHIPWSDILPDSGGSADFVRVVCPRCTAAVTPRRARDGRRWERVSPRP